MTGTVTEVVSGEMTRTSGESDTTATFCTNVPVRPVMIIRSVATSDSFMICEAGPDTSARSGSGDGSPTM